MMRIRRTAFRFEMIVEGFSRKRFTHLYQGLLHNLDVVFNMIQTLQYPTEFQDPVGNEIMRQNFNPTTETEQSRERRTEKKLPSNFII